MIMLLQTAFVLVAIIVNCEVVSGYLEDGLLMKNAAVNENQHHIYEEGCPTWMYHDKNTTSCVCGDSVTGTILCDESQPNGTLLQAGNCMTTELDETSKQIITVVGACPYFPFTISYKSEFVGSFFHIIPEDRLELNPMTCGLLNRTGRLCSSCVNGTFPSVLSYDRKCVPCSHSTVYSVFLILLTSFLPLTVFYCIVVLFRLSANHAFLNSFILVAQVMSAPQVVHIALHYFTNIVNERILILGRVLYTVYGIWNLDFFKLYLPDICIPNMTTLRALTFEFAVTVYPLVLTGVIYLLIELHDRNCKVFFLLFKPFHTLCIRFRKQWNIKTSIIDAFATFLLLSFMKLLIASIYFIMPVRIYNIHGEGINQGQYYLYYDAKTQLGSEYNIVVYIILSIVLFTSLVFLPVFLLLFYQTRLFQLCIGRRCSRCVSLQLTLKTFMDAFQGCYRDRTDGKLDCRFVSGLYLLLRVCLSITYAAQGSPFQAMILVVITSLLIAILRPYKKQYSFYNIADPVLLLVLALQLLSSRLLLDANIGFQKYTTGYQVAAAFSIIFPLFYMLCHVVYWIFRKASLGWTCKRQKHALAMGEQCTDDNTDQFRYNENSSKHLQCNDYGSMDT